MSAVATSRIARPALARSIADALEQGSLVITAAAGYGKTMALDEALRETGYRSVWVACDQTGGDAGRLLMATVESLRAVVPGAADVLADRLSAGTEPVDVAAAGSGLLAELGRLLVDRLVIVLDDAEALDASPVALALVDQLLGSRIAELSLAIATRRPLPLKLAKLRAGGKLTELGTADLTLTSAEAGELLRLRHGRALSDDEVEAALSATEGWPMGLALAGLAGASTNGPLGHDELFRYLAEEVLDGLEPTLRLALLDSSVPSRLSPEMADELALPAGFVDQVEQAGLFLRMRNGGARAYHPLFRAFLLEELERVRSPEEREALHMRAASSLARHGGSTSERIEHLLAAGDPDAALAVIGDRAQDLLRCAPDSVERWLARLPLRMHDVPMYLLLNARRLWGSGHVEDALPSLRAAASGFRVTRDRYNEWLTRLLLADAFVSVGCYDEVAPLMDGWQDGPGAAVAVAWYQVIALTATGRLDDADALADRLRSDPRTSVPFRHLDDVARVGCEPAAGRGRETLARLYETVALLERGDPHGRLPYAMAMVILVLRDLGEYAQALEWLDRCEREAARAGMGFVERDCQLQRAFLLARDGDLPAAELELARAGPRRGSGWRGAHRGEAEAKVASLRGESAQAVAAALRALDRVLPGPVCYRVWCALEMAPILAENGAPEAAKEAIDTALAVLNRGFPHEYGRMHRARLMAVRACIEFDAGELALASESIRWAWEEAGAGVAQVVRAQWPALQPALWHALATGAVAPGAVLPALQTAFPNGEALVEMIDHPEPAVRRAALSTALAANHPAALEQLAELAGDADARVAAAATATRERLRTQAPPLRFQLLGGFRVLRGGWTLDAWDRPMAARVVRFLLVNDDAAVPEDVLFEAFWADRPTDSARQHLAVAVSRARKVLDLPGADASVIEVKERTYRLALRDRDTVDVVDFCAAAAAALSDNGAGRRAALERAAALWTGEPLPEDRYAPWTFAWRERLAGTYSHVLDALVESCSAGGDHHHAVRAAHALLELDPLNESAHRSLIVGYARTGRTSHALRQYLECRRALVVGLGVEPSAETSRLQARILAGDPV